MTNPLYFYSDELIRSVVITESIVTNHGIAVILDETLFHPQGGGQPSDTGFIGQSRVTKVISKEGKILHFVDQPVNQQEEIIRIDEPARELNSRLHSAGHLLASILKDINLTPIKGHHWPGKSFIEIKSTKKTEENININYLEELINKLINQNLKRAISINSNHREIGYGSNNMIPCGGTHVKQTKMIGYCKITSIIKNDLAARINYQLSKDNQ